MVDRGFSIGVYFFEKCGVLCIDLNGFVLKFNLKEFFISVVLMVFMEFLRDLVYIDVWMMWIL